MSSDAIHHLAVHTDILRGPLAANRPNPGRYTRILGSLGETYSVADAIVVASEGGPILGSHQLANIDCLLEFFETVLVIIPSETVSLGL